MKNLRFAAGVFLFIASVMLIAFGANQKDAAQDSQTYKVVENSESQYSIWPADRENPMGWSDVGKSGTKEECLADIAKIWEDMKSKPKPTSAASPDPLPTEFKLPALGQSGRPVEIKGPFDGDVRTTEITIGGQPVTALAESRRSVFFISPEQKLGPNEITIKENGVETKGNYRNLGVRLSAPKTNLLKGESTTVTITVEGLNGIQQNVPLLLEKKGDVSMEGGDVQTIQIRPSDVVIERDHSRADVRKIVVGLRPGVFNITATVIDSRLRPIIIPLFENGGVNGYRVKKDGSGFLVNVENVKHPITGDPVDGKHKLEYQCPERGKLPLINSLFMNKGRGREKAVCLVIVTPRIIITDDN